LVPQNRRLDAVAEWLRRRMRRIAEARPVTDDVADRDIMVVCSVCFLARRHRGMSDRLRGRGLVLQVLSNLDDGGWMSARRGPGAWFGRSNRVVASDGLPR
jgi:hypothetical protein